MKQLSVLVFILFFSSLAIAAPRFEEGKHYAVIGNKASSSPIVTEMFSFYCAACNSFEFVAKGIEDSLPAGVKFNKNHVDFLHYASEEMQQNLSRAMVVIDKLKLGHKMSDAIFAHLHKDKKKFNSVADIRALFVANGVDGKKFDSAMKSMQIKGLANKMKRYQEELSNRKILTGIPLFIVNEKYTIIREELRSMEDYTALVKYLLTLK